MARERARLSPLLLVCALSVTSCATLKNTPIQEYLLDLGRACDTGTMWMSRVDPDGRYWVQGTTNLISVAPYIDCMKEQERRRPYATWLAAHGKPPASPPALASPQIPSAAGRTGTESPVKAAPAPPPRIALAAPTSVPVQLVNNIVLLPVTLNTKYGATLLLDTGSSITLLTPAAGRRLGLSPGADAPRRRVTIMGGSQIEFPLVRLSAMQIGDARIDDVEVGIHDVAPNAPIVDGVLGGDILGRFRLTLDREARQLRLEPAR